MDIKLAQGMYLEGKWFSIAFGENFTLHLDKKDFQKLMLVMEQGHEILNKPTPKMKRII